MTEFKNIRKHLCKDGSHTLYSEKFRQFYHNPNGAIAESRHVFFDIPRVMNRIQKRSTYNILEVGFGTGLNLLILLDNISRMDTYPEIFYRSIEVFPLKIDQAVSLNYPEKLELSNAIEILACIFRDLKPGINRIRVKKNVTVELFIGEFNDMADPEIKFDQIFFDPFSPSVNSELWTEGTFRKLASWSSPDVLLSTYCAASSARAAMAATGWKIARAPGALGKREMTLASLQPECLADWQRINEENLAERFRNGDFARESENM